MKVKHILFGNWRRLLLVAFPLLAALFSLVLAIPAHAAVTTNISTPFNSIVFVSCANGGRGESVSLTGTLHILFSTTVDSNGGFHSDAHFNPQGVTGIGQTTGNKYQGTGVTLTTFNGKVGAESTSVNNFRIIGQGPGNNFTVHENVHVTVNANGIVTASVDNVSITCS